MTKHVEDFFRKFYITVADIEKEYTPYLKQEDSQRGVCSLCRNSNNYHEHPSEAWTYISRCNSCNIIMVQYPQDLMSGCKNELPSVIYKDKI